MTLVKRSHRVSNQTHLDLSIKRHLFLVMLLVVIRVHSQVVELKLLLYSLLESSPLFQCQAVALGDDWHDIDKLAQLLEHHDVNWLQGVSRGLDKEQAAVDSGVLEITFALSSQFLAQVCRVLVLDVLDNWVPAALVVDQVAVTGGVDNVEAETDAVLFDDVRDGLDFGGAADWLIWLQTALAVHEVRGEDGVDEGGFAQSRLAWIWVRGAFAWIRAGGANIPTQMTLNWKPRFSSFFSICWVMLSKPTWLLG